jgi:hypothetical protein
MERSARLGIRLHVPPVELGGVRRIIVDGMEDSEMGTASHA